MLQKTIYKDTFRTGDPAGHVSVSIQHCLITGNSLAFGEVHSSSPNDRDTPRTHCELLSLSNITAGICTSQGGAWETESPGPLSHPVPSLTNVATWHRAVLLNN